jgi:hypothetical protein
MPDQDLSNRRKPVLNASGDREPAAADRPAAKKHAADPMHLERHQPDPALQLSTGWIGASGITLVALAAAIILGIVFYGLNRRAHNETAPSPAASSAPIPTVPTSPQGTQNNG